jgi:uncharacterized protein (DUF697 family)
VSPDASAAAIGRRSEIIRNHVLMAAAAGVLPLPLIDTAALMAVQLRLLKQLSEHFNVDFRADIGKSAAGTLLATIAPTMLAGGVLGSMFLRTALRAVPVIGAATRLSVQPAFNAAFTYALGKVFEQHFASGGTFLTFDPEAVKGYFREKFESVRNLKGGSADAVAAAT